MSLISECDRAYLENKYHKTSEPFNPYRRMAYHGYDFDPATGLTDDEIRAGLETLSQKNADLPHPIAKALAIRYVLENTRIDVNEHDFFVGFYSINRLISATTVSRWSREVFSRILPETAAEMQDFNKSGAVSIWVDYDHVIPDWESILTLGFIGIRERAARYRRRHEESGDMTPEMAAFFDGIDIEYTAIIDIIDRLYRYAKTQTHGKAAIIADCLAHIRDGAPTTAYEAMQVIYIYFMISESFDIFQVRSLGNGLDHSLLPFYVSDLADGRYTRDQIKELLAYFLFQWSALGNYWGQPFYLGGTNEDGSTKINDLTYDIINVYDTLGIFNPKMQIKLNVNTPPEFVFLVLDMIRRGHNSIVFCCEPGMIRAVMSYGATYEEALHMDIRGCYETGVRADEVACGIGYVNAPMAVVYALSDGYDKILGKRLGIQTGAPETLVSFDDFYNAVLAQWSYLIESTFRMADTFDPYLEVINPSSMYSGTIERSLRLGVDAYQGGVKFNNSAILNCGFATLVDSVMAVREFVYERQEVTLPELAEILRNNWQGHELLRAKVRNSLHKYGNGDDLTDRYAEAMGRYFAFKVNNRKNTRGGVYKAIVHSAMQFVWQGEKTPATPDGRCAGDEHSKNASPTPGMDKNGVTALIRSVCRLHPSLFPESFGVDVMLHPSAVAGDEGLIAMKAILDTYMEHDGMSIQFNVFDVEALREAQAHPEKYENLQVRVCGWNARWNDLSQAEQNAYILRADTAAR